MIDSDKYDGDDGSRFGIPCIESLLGSESKRSVPWVKEWCKYLEHVDFNDHHEILVNDNDFCSKGKLLCRRNSHLRERSLKYNCEIKSHIELKYKKN